MPNLFSSFASTVSKALTPITDRLRTQFGVGATTPAETKIPSVATPIADSLRTRFDIPSAPSFADLANQRQANIEKNTSPFLKNLFDTGGKLLKKGAGAADSFIADSGKNVQDFATGKLTLSADDWVSGMKTAGIGTLKLTGTLAQGFNQGILRIGRTLESALPGGSRALARADADPMSRELLRAIAGDPKIETYQNVFAGADQWALDKGATPDGAKFFAGFAVLGTLFMDEPGVGSPGKAAFKLSKEAVERAAREETEEGIIRIIKSENKNISDQAAEFISPLLRDAKTPEEVQQIVKFVQGSEKTALANAEKKRLVEEAKAAGREIDPTLKTVVEEARKYKTADEFADSIQYHGLSEGGYDDIVKNGFRDANEGVFIAKADEAKDYGDVIPVIVKKEAQEAGSLAKSLDGKVDITGTAYKAPDVIPLPRELADRQKAVEFYERAIAPEAKGSAESAVLPVPRSEPVDVNLVKKLGESKDPYEVLNILKNEYPNLPDRVVDKITERFIKTKRVANVENLLRSARSLDEKFKVGDLRTGDGPRVESTFGRKLTTKEQEAAALKRSEASLPKSSGEVLDATVNPTVRKLMRQDQKVAYIKAIKDKFEDPKAAAAGQQEYDRIWDDLNRKVIDEYEQISMQKSFMEDTLDQDLAEQLYKKYYKRARKSADDPTAELMEIMNQAQKKQRLMNQGVKSVTTRSGKRRALKLSKYEESALHLDTEIEELGYADFEEAQAAVERYVQMLNEVEVMGKQLKALKPRVREARILQSSLEDIAVIPRKEVEGIDRIITRTNVRDEFTDISGLAAQGRDLYRNFEKFFGKQYEQIKKAVLDPFDDSKGRFVDINNGLADQLDNDVVQKFGFRRGSRESAAIQRYGDTGLDAGERMSREDLIKEFGKEKADNIIAADAWFRAQYDRMIDELNVVRKKIYPNSPSKLIAKRKDYYRHFQDITETWGDALREFFETPSGIDPKLVGISEYTKAKTRFLPFALERKGTKSTIDAIGGFIDYVPAFAYAKEIDPQVSVFRYLRGKIADVAPRAGENITLPDGKPFQSAGTEGMVGFLDDFARDLTGNTNPADRFKQKLVGRKFIRVAKFINSRIKANTIGGNFGSVIAQPFNIPAGIADTKLYALKGARRTMASTIMDNVPMSKSTFLKERYAQSLNERFPFQFSDRPVKASSDFLKKQAGWIMRKGDEIGTKFIWNSEYEKGLALKGNVDDAVRYADGKTRKLVAGRGIGEVPLGQKALTTQFIAPFTVEVGNAWWIMRDFVKEKDITAMATFFIANYLMNEVAERVRGSRVAIDPINSLYQGAMALADEYEAGNTERGVIKFLGRQAGEVLANVPFGQTIAAGLPEEGFKYVSEKVTGAPMDKQQLFGTSNVSGRFGTPLIISGLQDAVYRVLPPVGGLQLKKTYQGILALVKGTAEDAKGSTTFEVPRSPQNVARALVFGANATSEAKKYFKERTDLFNRIDRQTADAFVRSATAEKDWATLKKLKDAGKSEEAQQLLRDIAAKDPTQAKAIARVASAEALGFTGNDRLIKMLNVENGERAKYIVEQLKKMKAPKDRSAYLADLAAKKLLSGNVAKQVALLMLATQ